MLHSSAFSLAQTLPLLPGLEVVTESTQSVEAAPEASSLEEAAPPMPQGNDPGAPQALDSTDLAVPTEAVTCECWLGGMGWQQEGIFFFDSGGLAKCYRCCPPSWALEGGSMSSGQIGGAMSLCLLATVMGGQAPRGLS